MALTTGCCADESIGFICDNGEKKSKLNFEPPPGVTGRSHTKISYGNTVPLLETNNLSWGHFPAYGDMKLLKGLFDPEAVDP